MNQLKPQNLEEALKEVANENLKTIITQQGWSQTLVMLSQIASKQADKYDELAAALLYDYNDAEELPKYKQLIKLESSTQTLHLALIKLSEAMK